MASCARAVPPRVEGTAKGTFDQLTPSPNNWSLPPSFRSTDTINRSPVKRSASPQTALKRAMTKSRGQSWPIFACPLRQPSLSFPSFGFSAFRGFGFAFITVSNAFSNRSQASGNSSISSVFGFGFPFGAAPERRHRVDTAKPLHEQASRVIAGNPVGGAIRLLLLPWGVL